MRKRWLKLAAVPVALAMVAAACGDDDDDSSDDTAAAEEEAAEEATDDEEMAEEEATEEESGGEEAAAGEGVKTCLVTDLAGIDDKSFNATAWQGVLDAIDNGDALPEPESFYLESDTEADWQPNIDQMISQGCEHIVTVGFALAEVTQTNAEANPDLKWTIVDFDFFDFDAGEDIVLDNAIELTYQTDEAAFLAGYVAASVSESGVVGTFGGANFPTVSIFMDGFYWGVQKHNEDKGTDVQVLGWDPANPDTGLFTGDFVDLDLARTTAQSLLDEGADVIMPVGGQINLGAAAAMTDMGMGASTGTFGALVGVDTDQYESVPEFADLWLTSVEKKMNLGVAESIEQTNTDTFEGGNFRGFLSNEMVDISPYHDFEDLVSDDTKAEVDALREAIIAGEQSVDGS